MNSCFFSPSPHPRHSFLLFLCPIRRKSRSNSSPVARSMIEKVLQIVLGVFVSSRPENVDHAPLQIKHFLFRYRKQTYRVSFDAIRTTNARSSRPFILFPTRSFGPFDPRAKETTSIYRSTYAKHYTRT